MGGVHAEVKGGYWLSSSVALLALSLVLSVNLTFTVSVRLAG